MKNMILLFDRVVSKILRIYRNYIFYAKPVPEPVWLGT